MATAKTEIRHCRCAPHNLARTSFRRERGTRARGHWQGDDSSHSLGRGRAFRPKKRNTWMRPIFMAVVLAAGLGILGASSASAAPANGAAIATANADNSQV